MVDTATAVVNPRTVTAARIRERIEPVEAAPPEGADAKLVPQNHRAPAGWGRFVCRSGTEPFRTRYVIARSRKDADAEYRRACGISREDATVYVVQLKD